MDKLSKAENLGRQVWLAGLGAYSTSWKYAVKTLESTQKKTNGLLDECLSKGEQIDVQMKESLKAKQFMEQKIKRLKDKLGFSNHNEDLLRLNALNVKIDHLIDVIAKMNEDKKKYPNKVKNHTFERKAVSKVKK
jgi:hypothetical protein